MTLFNLFEELKDISTVNQLYHRTNFDGLMGILNSGKIEGYDYEDKPSGIKTVATGRKAIFSKIDKGVSDPEHLSSSIGKVQIILFKDRIKGSHLTRGVKTKPIAELPIMDEKLLNRTLAKALYTKKVEDLTEPQKKKIKSFIEKTNKASKDIIDELVKYLVKAGRQSIPISIAKELIEKNTKLSSLYNEFIHLSPSETKSLVLEIIRNKVNTAFFKTYGKEHEERFTRKGNNMNIPVDDRLMRIELLPGFIRSANNNSELRRENIKKLIKKYEKVFVHNREYNKFMGS